MLRWKSDRCPRAVRSIACFTFFQRNMFLVCRNMFTCPEKEPQPRTCSLCSSPPQHSAWQQEHASSQRLMPCMIVILLPGKDVNDAASFTPFYPILHLH